MTKELQTILEALIIADNFCGKHTAEECPDTLAIPIKQALVALDTLAAEPSEDAHDEEQLETAKYLLDELNGYIKGRNKTYWLADFISIRDERIVRNVRQECADRADHYYRQTCGGCGEFEEQPCLQALAMGGELAHSASLCDHVHKLRAAITGAK